MKWLIIVILMVLFMGLVQASECEDVITPNQTCMMTTPYISCSIYNYSIINSSGSIVESDSLTLLNGGVYYFNFSQPKGGYVVKLCDQSTREAYVRGDDVSLSVAIIVGLVGLIVTVFLFNNSLGDEHEPLKFLLYCIMLFLGVGSVNISRILAEEVGNTALTSLLNTLYIVGTYTIYIFFGYVFVYILYKLLQFKGVIPK